MEKNQENKKIAKQIIIPEKMKKELNVESHIFVPKHVKLSQQEITEILERYNISIKQLSKILISDPALKPLDPKLGDVIKITRDSPTVGKSVFYRVVVDG